MQQHSSHSHEKMMPLTFGSIISLSPTDGQNSFIYVDGFIKDKVLIKKFDNTASKYIYTKCLFQIYPSFINTYKKEALALRDPVNLQKVPRGHQRIEMINNLQEKIATEFNFNLETFKKVKGQPVLFGQSIQLLHVSSNKFLAARSTQADLERENYQVSLDEHASDATVFKFLPCYKHQKESEGIIYIDDSIYISSATAILNKVPYLHISNPITVKLRNQDHQTQSVPNSTRLDTLPPSQRGEYMRPKFKIEVNSSLESQTRLKINYFTSPESETNTFLECGDIVWLNHSELDATLVCIREFKDNAFENRIEFDISKVTDNFKQFLGNTNGMWIIENGDYQKGGRVRWDQAYRFRHLGSGMYLGVQASRKKEERHTSLKITLEKEADEENLFTLLPVGGAHEANHHTANKFYVTKETFVLISHKKSELIIQASLQKGQVSKKPGVDAQRDSLILSNTKPCLIKRGAGIEEAAFKVIKANYNEVWETNFLISCFPILNNFLDTIKKNYVLYVKANSDRVWATYILTKMKSAKNCVENLNLFCKNELFNNTSPDQKYGEANAFRQKLLREQFFIDILAMLLKETVTIDELKLLEKSKKQEIATLHDDKISEEEGKETMSRLSIRDTLAPKQSEESREREYVKYIQKKVEFCHAIYALLTNICKDNYENEIYTSNLIPFFLIHCKYLPDAVECVISIIGNNETLLHKMSENLKMDIDKSISLPADGNIINVVINIRDPSNSIDTSQSFQPSFLKGRGQFRVSKPINLINFFLNLLKQKKDPDANVLLLTFFRKICAQKKAGVTINQDIIYRIFENNPNYAHETMITFEHSDEGITVTFPKNWVNNPLDGTISVTDCYKKDLEINPGNVKFLEEQLNLYSDLALSRNYLWKDFLEKRFPLKFVFSGIRNEDFSNTMRAALCMLALTVYIDHEPFNYLNLPNMCRVYKGWTKKSKTLRSKSSNGPVSSAQTKGNEDDMDYQLDKLINYTITYLQKEGQNISNELSRLLDTKVESQVEKIEKEAYLAMFKQDTAMKDHAKDFLNDTLLLHIVQLLSNLIKFDIFRLRKKQNLFYTVTESFVRLLEYDQKNPAHSYLLIKLREKNLKARKEKKANFTMSGIKSFIGAVVDNVTEITGAMGGLLGLTQEKGMTQNKKATVDVVEDQSLFNNPTMRTMISLHYHLERLKYDEEKKEKIDIEVKLEILDSLDFLLDMRKNYLVSNFLAWHQKLQSRMQKYTEGSKLKKFDQKLIEYLNSALPKILPPIAKTGILEIDEQFAIFKTEQSKHSSKVHKFIALFKKVATKNKHFKHYDIDDLAPDLDSLLLGKEPDSKGLTSDLLPSLLISFLTTKNSVLESRALDVMMRLFSQRAEMLDALQKLEILFDKVEIDTYMYLEKQSIKLKNLVEKLEIWLDQYLVREDYEDELDDTTKIVEDLTLLLNEQYYVDTEGNIKKNPDIPADKVNTSRQNIMKYLKTYKSLLVISKDGLHTLDRIILQKADINKKRKLADLFVKVHTCLKQFCKENETNQNILAEYRDIFIEYARLDVGQIDLLCSIYEGNKALCTTLPESFLNKFITLIESEGRQAIYLKFFIVIQKNKEIFFPENQAKVFKTLISTEESDLPNVYKTLYVGKRPNEESIHFEFDDFISSMENKGFIDKLEEYNFRATYRDEPFIYHAQLLSVLIETIKGSEGFNVNKAKLKTLFSFNYLMDLLLQPDSFTSHEEGNVVDDKVTDKLFDFKAEAISKLRTGFGDKNMNINPDSPSHQHQEYNEKKRGFTKLKGKLLAFIIELYFIPLSKINEHVSSGNKAFVKIVEKEALRFESLHENTHFEQEFLDYFFGSFLVLCNEYISNFLSESVLEESGKRKDNIALYKLAVAVEKKLQLFEGKLKRNYIRNLKSFLKGYVDVADEEFERKKNKLYLDNENEEDEPVPAAAAAAQKKKSLKQKSMKGEPINWVSQKSWARLMNILANNQVDWKKAIDAERKALSQAVLQFSTLFTKEDKEKYKISLDPKDVIRKFVKYLQYGYSNKAKKETMISTLQTLVQMIDVEDPKEKVKLQNMLDKYEATRMFLTVLSDSSNFSLDPEVFNNFLQLGIKLLEGGNSKIQKNIYSYFITFQKSEAIFAKFSAVITSFSNRLKSLNTPEALELEIVDLAEEYSNLGTVILDNTLRLLQLFTEGHFSDLQNYIRHQTNSRNNYDMVSAVTELLRSYLHHMTQANYDSIMKCLDTLAEFVQGPCPENQLSLIDGKFFEVVNTILTYSPKHGRKTFSGPKDNQRLSRKQTFMWTLKLGMERWMIARVKYKTMVLVNSLLEMRKDATTIKRIMRSLPVDVIKKHLADVWKVYKIMYGPKFVAESLGHYEGDPRLKTLNENEKEKKKKKKKEKDPEKDKYSYSDLITESGFAAYFLLESYYEVLDFDDDRRVLEAVKTKKKTSKTENSNLFQASVFGQMGKFLYSVIEQGLDAAELLKNQINKNLLGFVFDKDDREQILKELRNRELIKEGMKFFAENSSHIEVVRNKKIEKIYFYLQPFCSVLPKQIKTDFHDRVDRVSVQSKVNGLIQEAGQFIRIMKHEYRLTLFFNKYKILALFANHVNLWQDLSFTLALVVNFFILTSYSSEFSEDRLSEPRLFHMENLTNTFLILTILGIVMAISSAFVVLFYLFKTAPLVIENIWKPVEQDSSTKPRKKSLIGRLLSFTFKLIWTLFELLQTIEIVYYTFYGILAILGVTVHSFFFAFHLTEILLRYPTLKNVIRAFWNPRKALGLTFVLFIIFEYMFSLLAFVFFTDDFHSNCETTINCFLYTFDFTFKANGGIGGHLDDAYPRDAGSFKVGRFLFDNLFNLILVIIMVSIVAGVIIDTFGSLREKENEKNIDIRDICFICGNDKETFDRKSDAQGGFLEHIKVDHYMWDYVFYIAYLKSKDVTDYTGIESYIANKVDALDVSWFPLRKALALEDVKDETEKQMDQLNEIETNIIKIEETMKVSSKFNRLLRVTVKRYEKSHQLEAEENKILN